MSNTLNHLIISKLEAEKILSMYTNKHSNKSLGVSLYFVIEDQIHFWNTLCMLFSQYKLEISKIENVIDLSANNSCSPVVMAFMGGNSLFSVNHRMKCYSFIKNTFTDDDIFVIYANGMYMKKNLSNLYVIPENFYSLDLNINNLPHKFTSEINGLSFVFMRNFDSVRDREILNLAISLAKKGNWLMISAKNILELDYLKNIINTEGLTIKTFQNPITSFRDKYLCIIK